MWVARKDCTFSRSACASADREPHPITLGIGPAPLSHGDMTPRALPGGWRAFLRVAVKTLTCHSSTLHLISCPYCLPTIQQSFAVHLRRPILEQSQGGFFDSSSDARILYGSQGDRLF